MLYASLLSGIAESGLMGKLIVFILLVSSMGVWYIMIDKIVGIRRSRAETERFLHLFRTEVHPVALFLKDRQISGSSLIKIYNNCCRALGLQLNPNARDVSELFAGGLDYTLEPMQMEAVRHTAERKMADEALSLESGMSLLAIATSTAPFLGLLGTVWGIMDAFTAMAEVGAADMSAMAPGIASALTTTVVGLLVALPSMIGYNLIANSIRTMAVQMDNFAQEFLEEVQRATIK